MIEDVPRQAAIVLSALAAWPGNFIEPTEAFAHALHPQSAIGIQENVFGPIIIEKGEHLITEFPSQLCF